MELTLAYRIDDRTAVSALPPPSTTGTGSPGFFTSGNPQTGTAATVVTSDWLNMVQEELLGVVVLAGINPDKTNNNQLAAAIVSLLSKFASVAELDKAISQIRADEENFQPKGNYQPSGDYATNSSLQKYLPLTGGTLTGDVTIVANGTFDQTLFGGKVISGVAGQLPNSYLQTQIINGQPLAIIGHQNANGWHSWIFNPNDLSVTNPAGNSIPEVIGPSGRVVEQAFIVTGKGSGGPAGEAWVSFPIPFKSGTTPVVTAVINRETGVGVSRTIAFGNSGNTSQPNITNEGFSFQPIYLIANNIGASGNPWTLHVRAIGTM